MAAGTYTRESLNMAVPVRVPCGVAARKRYVAAEPPFGTLADLCIMHVASPQRPLPPPRKQWYDKLADAILGDDDSSATGASTRYALICQKCFAHNGLVKESMWEDARACFSPLSTYLC